MLCFISAITIEAMNKLNHFVKLSYNEQEIDYLIDGKYIFHANHDSHGYDGMEAIDTMFTRIAHHFKTEVTNTEGQYDETQ